MIRNYLLPIALGGITGGLLVGAFFVWPTVYGAKWWDVFTALGTVGAVCAAVGTVSLEQYKERKKLRRELRLVVTMLIESIDKIQLITCRYHKLRARGYGPARETGNYYLIFSVWQDTIKRIDFTKNELIDLGVSIMQLITTLEELKAVESNFLEGEEMKEGNIENELSFSLGFLEVTRKECIKFASEYSLIAKGEYDLKPRREMVEVLEYVRAKRHAH